MCFSMAEGEKRRGSVICPQQRAGCEQAQARWGGAGEAHGQACTRPSLPPWPVEQG